MRWRALSRNFGGRAQGAHFLHAHMGWIIFHGRKVVNGRARLALARDRVIAQAGALLGHHPRGEPS